MTNTEARFVLGLGPSFSPDELKRAYRKAAAENHPDRGGNPERMRLVNEAYGALSSNAVAGANRSQSDEGSSDDRQTTEPRPESAPGPDSPIQSRDPHPFRKYVIRGSFALGVWTWLYMLVAGPAASPSDWWTLLLIGLPLFWGICYALVHTLFFFAIHAYNVGLRVQDWRRARGF